MEMENFQISGEISALQKLTEEYERQLKMFGLDLGDLPESCASLLNEYAELKSKTKLHDLSTTFLDEFLFARRKEYIEQQTIASKLKNEIKQLETKLVAEELSLNELSEFLNSVDSRIVSQTEVEKNKILTEKKMEGLKSKQHSFQVPKDLDIDDLIAKVERLEKR